MPLEHPQHHPQQQTQQQQQLLRTPKKRRTMIKHVVGKVRATSYCLPEGDDFVYGVANTIDEEGAGKIVQSWAQSEPSEPLESMRSFPATNREALRNGCLTARSQREFAKSHPVMKQKPGCRRTFSSGGGGNNDQDSSVVDLGEAGAGGIAGAGIAAAASSDDRVFGIQSIRNDVPMSVLLQCPKSDLEEERDYPDVHNMKKKGRLPPAKSTKASRLLVRHRDVVPSYSGGGASSELEDRTGAAAAAGREEFKIGRFVNNASSKVREMMI